MSEARAQRDRRLIVRTAALLSEDYPLDQLAARLCDALASELEARLAFVAQATEPNDTPRVIAAAGAESALQPVGSLLLAGSPAMAAFVAGAPQCSPDASEIFAPLVVGEQTLGLLAVYGGRGRTFDEQDLRLLQAVARYLAIAVRNQRSVEAPPAPRDSRFLVYGAIVLVAFVLSGAIWANVWLRSHEMVAGARAAATSRLASTASSLADHIGVSAQLAQTAASIFSGMPHDRALVENTLEELLRSARNESVFGVGVWYERFRFAPNVELYGPYAERSGNAPVSITYQWMTRSYDYPSHPWYRLGMSKGGALAYTEPYFDTDFVYVSAVRDFRDARGRVEGVVTVDSILQQYESVIGRDPLPRSLVYVVSSSDHAIMTSDDAQLLAFARERGVAEKNVGQVPRPVFDAYVASKIGGDTETFTQPLPVTGWSVKLAVDRNVLFQDAHRFRNLGYAAIALLWLVAVAIIVFLWRTQRQVARAVDLERQQRALTREIAERKKAEELLRERAYRDELTHLPNRAFVIGELHRALEDLSLDGEGRFALVYIDLDRFNLINDSLGHDTGDLLLAEIARRLNGVAGAGRLVARLGGDEFVILLPGDGRREAVKLAERISGLLRRAFTVSGHELFVSASLGIALVDATYTMPEEVLRDADAAMYEAKRSGRGTFRIFDQSMRARALEALSVETDLRWALVRNEIAPAYQPIVAVADGRIVGFEALARWKHPTRGIVAAEGFIAVAEQAGLIVDIDQRMLAAVCAKTRAWLQEFPDIFISLNVSAAHLARTGDLGVLQRVIEAAEFPVSQLRLELTETAVMESRGKPEDVFGAVRELGVGIFVDDFGSGYSSLGYLLQLPIDGLKIDRSFIGEMTHNAKAGAIVNAILAISDALGMRLIAEGVETREEVDRLRAIGVPLAQGYYFGDAVEADAALAILRESVSKRPVTS